MAPEAGDAFRSLRSWICGREADHRGVQRRILKMASVMTPATGSKRMGNGEAMCASRDVM